MVLLKDWVSLARHQKYGTHLYACLALWPVPSLGFMAGLGHLAALPKLGHDEKLQLMLCMQKYRALSTFTCLLYWMVESRHLVTDGVAWESCQPLTVIAHVCWTSRRKLRVWFSLALLLEVWFSSTLPLDLVRNPPSSTGMCLLCDCIW